VCEVGVAGSSLEAACLDQERVIKAVIRYNDDATVSCDVDEVIENSDYQLTFFSGAINMLNLAVQYFLYGFHLVI